LVLLYSDTVLVLKANMLNKNINNGNFAQDQLSSIY